MEEGTDILDNVMTSFDKWNTFTDELTKQRDRLIQDVSVMTLNEKKLKDKNEGIQLFYYLIGRKNVNDITTVTQLVLFKKKLLSPFVAFHTVCLWADA